MNSRKRVEFPASARGAREVARRIIKAGGEAYVIGGCVRDLVLGIEPKDYDVATSLQPEEVMKLFPGANETGKCFGVVRVGRGENEVEVATFRHDGPYSDGRRPDFVEFTSLEEDIKRRDFTINALAADIVTGEVIDLVSGLDDLARKIVRTVGDPVARFTEDKLRLIRCIRFSHRLGFSIDPATGAALKEMAKSINDVAMERISDEFQKIIMAHPAGDGVRLLDEYGLLTHILPEFIKLKGVEQPEQFHPEGDVYVHTLLTMNELKRDPTQAMAWGALLHDIGKPDTQTESDRIRFHGHAELGARMAEKIGRRMKLSNALIDRVKVVILEHQKFADVDKMRPGRLKNWASQPHFEDLLEVHRADCAGSHKDMSAFETASAMLTEIRKLESMPKRIVTGDVLMEMGLTPGPHFRALIESAYEAQLENRFSTLDAGKEFVLLYIQRRGDTMGEDTECS